MEDLVDSLTRGNPGSVKTVLAAVVLALAGYQLVLAAIGYGKLPLIAARPAFFTHRASGDAIVVVVAGFALAAVLAFKIAVVRGLIPLGGLLPYLGAGVFALLALTCFTSSWFDS